MRMLVLLVVAWLPLSALAEYAGPGPRHPEELAFSELAWAPPACERLELPGGAVLYLLEDHELPLVRGRLLILGGAAHEPDAKSGLTSLLMHVLRTGGAGSRSAEEVDEALEFVAASIETSADADRCGVSFNCLAKDLDDVWTILVEMLARPRFEERYVDERKNQMLEALRRENDRPEQILFREYRALLYPGHAYGRRKDGTADTLPGLSREDLLAWHPRLFSPARMVFGVAGDFDAAQMRRRIETLLEDWPHPPAELPDLPPLPEARRGIFIYEKAVAQTSLILAHRGPVRPHPDYHAVEVMNFILGGGSFSSRLTDVVRSKEGLAYGVASFFGYGRDRGAFGAFCQTKPETSYRAAELLRAEIERIRSEPVSPEELRLARDSLVNSFIFQFDSPDTYLGNLLDLEFYGEIPAFLAGYIEKIEKVDVGEVRRVAEKYLRPDEALLLLVGEEGKFDARPARLPGPHALGERPAASSP